MNKVMMTIAGMLFIGVTALQAQTDTTQRTPTQQPATPGQVPQGQDQDYLNQQQPSQSMYRTQDRITVSSDQVPSALRETLQGSQYKGWESVPLYQDKTTQEYYFEMNDGTGNKSTTKLYRFDRNGKPISGSGSSTQPRGGQ